MAAEAIHTCGPAEDKTPVFLKKNDSIDSLFKRADEALYMSKRTGRNKVSTT